MILTEFFRIFERKNMEKEVWKRVPINGLEDKYEVSNFGRLKTLRYNKVIADGA